MSMIQLLASCDTMLVQMCEKTCKCVNSTQQVSTNWADVRITIWICCTIVAVAIICAISILAWKRNSNKAGKTDSTEKEKRDKYFKQRSDLLDKKLQILKDSCEKKELIEDKVGKYTAAIDAELNKLDILLEFPKSNPKPVDSNTEPKPTPTDN